MSKIPDPNQVFANEYGTSVYLKNVVKARNIEVGDYTYCDGSIECGRRHSFADRCSGDCCRTIWCHLRV